MKTIQGLVVLTAITVVLLSGVRDVKAQQKTRPLQVDWRTSLYEATNLAREMEKNPNTRDLAQETLAALQSIDMTMIDAEDLMAEFLKIHLMDPPTATKIANELKTLSDDLQVLMWKLQKKRYYDNRLYTLISNIMKVLKDTENAIIQNVR